MSEDKKAVVIYHANCADGFTAAWVAGRALGKEVEFIPGVYQTPVNVATLIGTDVYILDFSYDLETTSKICAVAKTVTMLDHHATAKPVFDACKDQFDNFTGDFDLDRSGALITWDWFNRGQLAPMLVRIVSDRDLWKFEMAVTRDVMANIFSYEYSFENWDNLYMLLETNHGLLRLTRDGEAITRKHNKDIAELLAVCKHYKKIAGHIVPVASLPYTMSSEAGHVMVTEPGYEHLFAACYWDIPRGRVFSLRSGSQGMDVSAVAQKFGGGGHKHAAGFTIEDWDLTTTPDLFQEEVTWRKVE